MDLEEIKIKVSPNIAKAFKAFTESEQEKYGILFGAVVRRPRLSRSEGLAEFKRLTAQARKQAKETGLTPEELDAILNDK
ncbi:MAG: hypothetical protein R6U29_03950 [Desulfosudaceae bacterium]